MRASKLPLHLRQPRELIDPWYKYGRKVCRGFDYRVFWRRTGTPQLSVQIAIVEYHYNGARIGNFRKIVGMI